MKTQQPIIRDDDEHRVLHFVPRASSTLPQHPTTPVPRTPPPANDLSRYEEPPEPDDYRQRMIANLAALVFTLLLVAAGFWLAVSLNDLRKTQDCVLSGRRDCAPITTSGN